MTSMPDTNDRWKLISIVTIFIALISIVLNVYFYLSDDSEIASGVNNETDCSNVSNVSGENGTWIRKIARVAVTPGDTVEIN